ncbi:hypothetical protein R6T71_25560 [Klebsiella pneumoniae]|uniref:hypothetical protein n=1 Tax=Klebsiella pneumoniae TaxID=573 RepID=UPI0027F4401D|nr:hypothetical protein [Klebsiella pneumoniae]MDV8968669.1 hypothetical protein [Klebsiella pneumoniae]MDV8979775.1 hypothetical protein [Klebsiella pneumoniae]MDZ3495838.1 hypothetical protein [Klebsiella pneumoniae]MDZ3578021.1 hypothetical protein [Klebsiella pneumoniae]MDZ3589405.1 hypothetical protein [Klebsiella pneumoniae]
MTKSTITRERLQEIAEDGFLKHGESKELARMVLAAIDSEPVVFTDERNLHRIAVGRETALIWGKQNQEGGDIPLYRHAQPAPVATSEEHRQLRDLVMMVKMLCRTVRKYNPESQQAANFTAYLQKEGLISAADCLRETDPLDTESEDRRG